MPDPFDVPGGNISSHWEPEPNTRGTWSILSTCLVTMTFCVWSALHINISEPEGQGRNTERKAWWLLMGLFGPEMIALAAVDQNLNARQLTAEMRKHFRQNKQHSPIKKANYKFLSTYFGLCQASSQDLEMSESHGTETPLRSHTWTLTHSHYALMGGYAISDLAPSSNILPNRRSRLTLTPVALLFLAEHHPDLIPDLSEEEIWDKSKANSLTKAIVCIQASWFCIQCISRLAAGLPISLLELNTLGHSICALIIYLQWWSKPLDIGLPSIIPIKGQEGLFSAMIMRSAVGQRFDRMNELQSGQLTSSTRVNEKPLSKRAARFFFVILPDLSLPRRERLQTLIHVLHRLVMTRSFSTTMELCTSSKINAIAQRQFDEEHLKDIAIAQECTSESVYVCAGYTIKHNRYFRNLFDSRSDLHIPMQVSTRGHLVERFGILGQYKLWRLFTSADVARFELADAYHHDATPQLPDDCNFVTDRIGDFLASDGTVDRSGFSLFVKIIAVTIPTCLYGVTHIIAWNAPFSSSTQSLMWRISGVVLFAPTIALAAVGLYFTVTLISSCFRNQSVSTDQTLSMLYGKLSRFLESVCNPDADLLYPMFFMLLNALSTSCILLPLFTSFKIGPFTFLISLECLDTVTRPVVEHSAKFVRNLRSVTSTEI